MTSPTAATCSNCNRETRVLVVLTFPHGEHRLCVTCFAPSKPAIATQRKDKRR